MIKNENKCSKIRDFRENYELYNENEYYIYNP